jgi:hypothetical protein
MKTKILKPEPMSYGQRFVMTFIMLSVIKNLPKIQALELTESTPTTQVINDALQIKTTGDHDCTAPPVTDALLHGAANQLQTVYTGSKASPPLYTSGNVITQKNIVITMYNKVINYIKGVANDVAIAAGDVTAGNSVVTRCGGKLKKKSVPFKPDFGVTKSGTAWVQIHAKKAKKGNEGHIFKCGITTTKGTPPAKTAIFEFFSLECDIIINDLTSGTILAIDHASIVPVSHAKKISVLVPATAKKATPTPMSKAKHPVFSITSPDSYTWNGWIYVVIQ